MPSKNKIVAVTMGDPAGIGPEVIARAFARKSLSAEIDKTLLVGDECVYRYYRRRQSRNVPFYDVRALIPEEWQPGQGTPQTAQASLLYLNAALDLLKRGQVAALVTAPVHKQNISALGASFPGHTEYLAKAFRCPRVEMMFVGGPLRTLVLTRHIPLKDVAAQLTRKRIFAAIQAAIGSLKRDFKIKAPRIGVCGLNPHAGEGGHIGQEEARVIVPAIRQAQGQGWQVAGPFPADTIFTPEMSSRLDLILAMYHDQGLIAVKSRSFHKLVNFTVGLPFVRTSPAHGTAFDIAGKNLSDCGSMHAAIQLAHHLVSS